MKQTVRGDPQSVPQRNLRHCGMNFGAIMSKWSIVRRLIQTIEMILSILCTRIGDPVFTRVGKKKVITLASVDSHKYTLANEERK